MQRIGSQRGFTLVELMVTIAIAAILMGIAVISFMETRRKTAVREGARTLEGDLMLARTAARTRQDTVRVSMTMAGTVYTIYIDEDSSGAYNAPTDVLVIDGDLDNGAVFDTATSASFDYTPTGMLGAMNEVTLKHVDPNISDRYKVTVYITGICRVDRSTDAGSTWARAW